MDIIIIGDSQKIEYFKSKVLPLNNKAEKLGMLPISLKRVGTSFKSYWDKHKKEHVQYQEYVYHLKGDVPKIEGYEYLGKVEHVNKAGNLIYAIKEDENLDMYREGVGVCQHCGTKRHRKYTHILRKDGQEFQVGSNCLADFLRDNEYLKLLENYFELAKEASSPESCYTRFSHVIFVEEFMDAVLTYTLSANQDISESFKNLLISYIQYQYGLITFTGQNAREERARFLEKCEIFLRPVAVEKKSEVRAKVEEFLNSKANNFVHNLWILRQEQELPFKKLRMAIWLVLAYFKDLDRSNAELLRRKEMEQKQREAAKISSHKGAVGETLQIYAEVVSKTTGEGHYGQWVRLTLKDFKGGVYVIKGTAKAAWDMEKGAKYSLTATVKEHTEWQGVQQTVIWKLKNVLKEEIKEG